MSLKIYLNNDRLPLNRIKHREQAEIPWRCAVETGTQRNTTIVSGVASPLQSVTLSKGGKTSGNMVFEAKADSKTLKLHYEGGIFGGQEVIVNL